MAQDVQLRIAPKSSPETPEKDDDRDGKEYWSLEKCKRAYTRYIEDKHDEIEEQQDARRYRHGAQWTQAQVEIFDKRKQPVVTYNRIGRKIDAIVGLMEKLKQDPKGFPRNPRDTDQTQAELATAAIRYVIEGELKEHKFPFSVEMGAVDGVGGVEMLLIEGDHGDPDISFAIVDTDSFFYDPRSFRHDFSDARYLGVGKWLDVEDVKDLVPEKADEIDGESGSGFELSSSPDREKYWFNDEGADEQKRIRVVDIWYKHQGGWCWCLFTGSRKLMEGKSYFYDERGKPICKYVMFSAFVDHDGDRYGFVRGLRSSQDEINQRRSKGLHELVSRRIKAEDGAFADIELARREAVRPDGVVIYNKGFEMEFDDAARIANVEGQLKFLEDAKNEIENFGPNPALIGQGLEYKSGRAINLLQQAGIAELGPFVIAIKNWKLRIYRAIWSAIQRYWEAERWIRVVDDEGLSQFVQVNGVGIDERTGFPIMVNQLGNLDVNFVLEEGPDEVNMMADAYDTLVALATQGAQIPPAVLLELAPLHASVKRKLQAMMQRPDPMQEQRKQIELQGGMAKVQETQSKAQLNQAKAAEAAQGGAHGVMERQMDAAMKEREMQLKERTEAVKVQGKIAETRAKLQGQQAEQAIKLQGQRQQTRMKAQEQVVKAQGNIFQNQQKLVMEGQRHRQQMFQSAQEHRRKLQTSQPVRPKGGGQS